MALQRGKKRDVRIQNILLKSSVTPVIDVHNGNHVSVF